MDFPSPIGRSYPSGKLCCGRQKKVRARPKVYTGIRPAKASKITVTSPGLRRDLNNGDILVPSQKAIYDHMITNLENFETTEIPTNEVACFLKEGIKIQANQYVHFAASIRSLPLTNGF